MQNSTLNRRDFVKLTGLIPLVYAIQQTEWKSIPKLPVTKNENQPNILILVLDAFSASNSSLFGYSRYTTPNIERFANRATVFNRHYAAGNFTTPGTASLLTGTYPWTNRAIQVMGSIARNNRIPDLFSSLLGRYYAFAYTHNPQAFVLLHEFRKSIENLTPISQLCLANNSMVDRFFIKDFPIAFEAENLVLRNSTYPSSSLFLSPLDNLKRLFMRHTLDSAFQERYPRGISRLSFEAPPGFMYFLLEDAIDWLQEKLSIVNSPFLGYIHFLPPHHPYVTRKEFYNQFDDGWEPVAKPSHFFSMRYSQETLNTLRRQYDESIAYVDAEFGRLYEMLHDSGMIDNTYVILTSDHGEMFERGIWAHNTPTLYEPIVHIPLLISSPGQKVRRDVFTPTSNVDILPTLCQIADIPIPIECEGEPLPLSDSDKEQADRSIFVVEAKENPKNAPLRKATIAMIKGQYKLIYSFGYKGYPDTFELYDLEMDPEEMINLYNPSDPISITMQEELLNQIYSVNNKRD